MKYPRLYPKNTIERVWLVWSAGVCLGGSLQIASWVFHVDGVIRVLANFAYILALPGWIPMHAIGISGIRDHALGILIANGIAWGFWVGGVLLALKLRARCIDRPTQQVTSSSRRAFLSNSTLGVLGIGAATAPGYATLVEPWTIKTRRYTIPIEGLPSSLDGFVLGQFADTHLGPRIPASFIRSAVEILLSESPDLVLLTGDHVHDGTQEIELAAELCRPLVEGASVGVVGVLGNHDWWGDGDWMSRALRDQGVHMIDNDRVWIDPSTRSIVTSKPAGESLAVVGLGDLTDGVIDVPMAFRDIDQQTPALVLSHNPDSAELESLIGQSRPRIDLMCSGHTHGGQVRIPFLGTPLVPSRFGSKYAGGLVDGPAFRVHISRGVGMSLLPVRVGVPPEISVITLKCK